MLVSIFILLSFVFSNTTFSYKTLLPSKKNMIGMPIEIVTTIDLIDTLKISNVSLISKDDYDLDTLLIKENNIIQRILVWNNHGIFSTPNLMVYLSNNERLVDSIQISGRGFFVDSTIISYDNILDNKGLRIIKNDTYKTVAIYVLIIFISIFFVLFINKRPKKSKNKYVLKNIYKYQDAKIDIEKLDLSNSNSDIIKNYLNLSIILRKYISSKFFINTEKMTSKEIFHFFEKNIEDKDMINNLKMLFNAIDLVKYSNDSSKIIEKSKVLNLIQQIKSYKNL